MEFHQTPQDKESPGWLHLLELVAEARSDRRKEFAPLDELTDEELVDVVTLPSSIGELDKVRHLVLYGGFLERVPREIGQLRRLREFTPYKCHRLHWLPFEIRRCGKLRCTTISTRTLYGNWKNRAPFPALPVGPSLLEAVLDLQPGTEVACSICRSDRPAVELNQRWLSIRVGTDVMPLLVTACSEACLASLPEPARGFVDHAHQGGPKLVQPLEKGWS